MPVSENQRGFVSNYTTAQTIISGRGKRDSSAGKMGHKRAWRSMGVCDSGVLSGAVVGDKEIGDGKESLTGSDFPPW